jgi:hypothetical protein
VKEFLINIAKVLGGSCALITVAMLLIRFAIFMYDLILGGVAPR